MMEHTMVMERPQTRPLLFYVHSNFWSLPWCGCRARSRYHHRWHGIWGNLSGFGTRRPPFVWHSWLVPAVRRPTDYSHVQNYCHCPRSRLSMSPDGRGDDRLRNVSHLNKPQIIRLNGREKYLNLLIPMTVGSVSTITRRGTTFLSKPDAPKNVW